MSVSAEKILKSISPKKIIIPVIIGLGVVITMLYFEIKSVEKIQINVSNYSAQNADWKKIKANKENNIFTVSIKDSTLTKRKDKEITVQYFLPDKEKRIMIKDTLNLINNKIQLKLSPNSCLQKAEIKNKNTIILHFNKSLKSVFAFLKFRSHTFFWLFLAFLMMFIRDFGYMLRIRILSNNALSWQQSFNLIMLWEFSSALSPSAIGGSGIAIYLIHKEGLNVGKSTAVIMSSIFLDELYFILAVPLLFVTVSGTALFTIGGEALSENAISFTNQFFYFAIIGYVVIFIFTAFLMYGLFLNPRGLKLLLLNIFKLPILRRWRDGANKTGTDLIISSTELKKQSLKFWLKAFGATIFSWTGRYWIVNILLVGLIGSLALDTSVLDHFLIFARQLVMWIMMIVSPTPGGSGFAEFVFSQYLGEFIPIGFAVAMALLWRIISYYPYLFIGTIVLARWFKQKYAKTSLNEK